MPTLRFSPRQPHYGLEMEGRTITAGESFEVSEEEARRLLTIPEVEVVASESRKQAHSPVGHSDKTT